MEDIKRYRLFTHDDGDGFPYTDNEIKKDGEWVKYSDHKAVVKTIQQDHENKIYHKDTEVNLAHGECEQLRLKVSEMQNKIEELKAVIGGEYTGYYCAEHGAINGVEVTYYEKCAICGRDANHIPEGIK